MAYLQSLQQSEVIQYPLGSMGLVYLPTFPYNSTECSQSHGSYGYISPHRNQPGWEMMSTIKLELLVSGFLPPESPSIQKSTKTFRRTLLLIQPSFWKCRSIGHMWLHLWQSRSPEKNLEKDGWFVCLYDGGYLKDLRFPSTASVKDGRIKAMDLNNSNSKLIPAPNDVNSNLC